MPSWGRPPGGSSGVGRYYDGVQDDVHRFQELDSEDEKGGVVLDQAFHPALNGTSINPDELYFNDMDIRAWEGRTLALGEAADRPDHNYQNYQDGYRDDMGSKINSLEHEEMLFRRVLDKIRIARAAGNTDVSLKPEELDAYHSRLYGSRSTPVHAETQSRPSNASFSNDAASMISADATSKHGSSSRSKKNQQRTSIFGSKSKKEKSSSHKRTPTTDSHAPPPGFVLPGPDGRPVYAPINAYQDNLEREREPLRRASRSASEASHHVTTPSQASFSRDMLGAFPESEYDYGPTTRPRQGRSIHARQAAYEADLPHGSHTRSSSVQSAGLVPFPVEPYQYHTFSPASSSSPTSPQPQYTRRVSSGVSEASYTSVPRRVPVPAPALLTPQRAALVAGSHVNQSDPAQTPQASSSALAAQVAETTRGSSGGHGGERRRKSGKSSRKKG